MKYGGKSVKYQLQYVPNPDRIHIDIDRKLHHRGNVSYQGYDHDREDIAKARPVEGLLAFLETIHELDGMDGHGIYVEPYAIAFGKASLFSWNDILPHVIEAMRAFLANGDLVEAGPAQRMLIDNEGRASYVQDQPATVKSDS